jgi:hypothetical protein
MMTLRTPKTTIFITARAMSAITGLELWFMDGIRRSCLADRSLLLMNHLHQLILLIMIIIITPSVDLQYSLFPMDLSSTTSSVSLGTPQGCVESV